MGGHSQNINLKSSKKAAHRPSRRQRQTMMPIFTRFGSNSRRCTQISKIIGRSSNILGEVSERIVATFHDGKLLAASSASADVILPDGKRIQVKSRTPRQTLTTSLGIVRSWDFDILAVLLFDEFGDIIFGGEIDVDSTRKHAVANRHQNGWVITTTNNFLNDPRMKNLTRQYNETLMNL